MKYFKDTNNGTFKFFQTCNTKMFLRFNKNKLGIPGVIFFQYLF